MGWIGEVVLAVFQGGWLIFKGIFSTDKPQEDRVIHAKRDLEVNNDGKTDKDRINDLGL